MKIQALVGAAALSALVMSGAAFAQDASSSAPAGPPAAGTMNPIPNPPSTGGKHMKGHHGKKHHAKKRHAKHKSAKAAAPAAAPAK